MSLPTPPRSSHSTSNKENKQISSTRGVAWAQHNQIHTLSFSPPSKLSRTPTSASRDRPARSILKKHSISGLGQLPKDDICDIKPRDVTPEPEDPLCSLKYLENPVWCIVSHEARLKELIEAYNVLAARLRSSLTNAVKGGTETVDASWPLFQPLRKNREAFVKAVVRDLGRALVDPLAEEESCEGRKQDRILVPLPSPNNTPRKKRDGMTAEQVKYARDLCTISHSVIRFLNVVWTVPAICGIFSEEEHEEILKVVLDIPLAAELPTINARKTCALAIWLLQTQRLPKDVLCLATDKIVAALKRAIDGELGKEGKKGSVSDGLRAIHDLCIHHPTVFVKPFAPLLPTILQNLLAPTLALRVQACQSLGGIVTGANKAINRRGHIHARYARLVRFFLTRSLNKDKEAKDESTKSTASVPSTPKEPAIIRTLRVTLEATDPQHSAQGPVWALNVIANFVALLGPVLVEDNALRRTISSLMSLGLQHPKSSVRALACIVWRPLVWSFFQPPFTYDVVGEARTDSVDQLDDLENLSDEEKEDRKRARKEEREIERVKDIANGKKAMWKFLASVVECQTGVMTIAALLSFSNPGEDTEEGEGDDDEAIERVISLLKLMILKGGQNCGEAVEITRRLVRFDQTDAEPEAHLAWHMNMLLPRSLYSATSNLLAIEFKSLSTTVRAIMDRSAGSEAVRTLTREELAKPWVFDGLIDVWRDAVACLEMSDADEAPTDVAEVWNGLLKASVGHLQDSGDDAATIAFTIKTAKVLIDIVQDRNIDLTPKPTIPPSSIPAPKTEIEVIPITFSSDPPQEDLVPAQRLTNGALKLRLTRDLWATVRTLVPHSLLGQASERLLSCLAKNEDELLGGGDVLDFETERDEDAVKLWAQFTAELAMCCDLAIVRSFWGCERRTAFSWNQQGTPRRTVWRAFAELWQDEASCTPESSTVVLCALFLDPSPDCASVDDLPTWEGLLETTIAKALDNGCDSSSVLEDVTSTLLDAFDFEGIPCTPAFIRATDVLLSHFDIDSTTGDLPISLFRLVNDVLYATYPPSYAVKQYARWVLRTLSDILRRLDGCGLENLSMDVQTDVVNAIATAVKQSVSLWIVDKKEVMDEDEWSYDMEPLYGYLLSALSLLPRTLETLMDHVTIVQSALCGNEFRTQLAADAFRDFWAHFSGVSVPRSGCWPEGLVRCARAAGLDISAEFASPEPTEEVLPPSSPLTLVDEGDSDEQGSDSLTLCPPSTPSKRLLALKVTTPVSLSRLALATCSPTSPSWIAMKNNAADSRKRRRLANESLCERDTEDFLAVESTASPLFSSPSKRKLDTELDVCEDEHRSPSKRSRAYVTPANDIEDEDDVAASLLTSSRLEDDISLTSVPTSRRKRVTMVMDAVEVPTLKTIAAGYRHRVCKSSSAKESKTSELTDQDRRALQLKRKRRHSIDNDYEDLFGPLPLPSVLALASCRRSTTMPTVVTAATTTPTPTRIYCRKRPNHPIAAREIPSSPSPRQHSARALVNDSENEDDRSALCSSPLKAAMLRKSHRTGSFS